MSIDNLNVSLSELGKFDAIASEWWDPLGKLRTLHVVNPVRLKYIENIVELKNRKVLDVGCGGGILSEAMASRHALVTAIDASETSIRIAKNHLTESGLSVNYFTCTVEQYASDTHQQFDVISCMEMLEHVPNPESIIESSSRLLKPGGHLFLSTINRNLQSYLGTIVGAEHILNMLPVGTHDYAQYIRPAELGHWLRNFGMEVMDISGIRYLPFLHMAHLCTSPAINYIVHAQKPV